jgi:transketolase
MSADPGCTSMMRTKGLWPGYLRDDEPWPDRGRFVNLDAHEWRTSDQGLACAVGMALAEQKLASHDGDIVDHRIWVLGSDRHLLPDDSLEAASLAGQLGLSRLTVVARAAAVGLSDDDLCARFATYGWHGLHVEEDQEAIHGALRAAIDERERPTLIVVRTRRRQQALDAQVYRSAFATAAAQARRAWNRRVSIWAAAEPLRSPERWRTQADRSPDALDAALPIFEAGRAITLREASESTLLAVTRVMPELIGVSALHAAGWVCNGIALHGGLRPYARARLEHSGHLLPAIRFAAARRLSMVFVLSHDPIGQDRCSVEHLAALRAIPGLAVLRPADAGETVEAWYVALRRSGPTVLILTRAKVVTIPARPPHGALERAGAWTVREVTGRPDIVLIGTGPEVGLCLAAAGLLRADGVAARVVSMPWRERFLATPGSGRDTLLCSGVPRVVVEAGVPQGLQRLAGPTGRVISTAWPDTRERDAQIMREPRLTPERIAIIAHDTLAGASASPWWYERDA